MYIPTSFFATTTRITASVDYLLVGGGGAGGVNTSGGGAGGGFASGSLIITQYGNYPILIGAGGVTASIDTVGINMHGQPTYALGMIAYGGGSGQSASPGFGTASMRDGASGAGGGGPVIGFGLAIHNNVYDKPQGNDGGASNYLTAPEPTNGWSGGGGGGASVTGSSVYFLTGSSWQGGAGGAGKQWLDGNYYAGGGGGGTRAESGQGAFINVAFGGIGGGGNGQKMEGVTILNNATSGTPNTGGGGGGRSFTFTGQRSTSGGSGIVKIRYLSGSINATGGTITNVSGYTYHTFLSSSVFTLSP